MIEDIKSGALDAAMLALPVAEPDIDTIALFEDLFLLAVPASDPRLETSRVAAEDIDQSRLILLEDGHCLRDQALAFCATATRVRTSAGGGTVFGASSLNTVMQMVAGGYGVTLIPQIAADVERRDAQGEIPAAGKPAARPQHRPRVPPLLAAQGGFCRAG